MVATDAEEYLQSRRCDHMECLKEQQMAEDKSDTSSPRQLHPAKRIGRSIKKRKMWLLYERSIPVKLRQYQRH